MVLFLLFGEEYVVDHAVILCLLGCHPVVTVRVGLYLLEGLAAVVGVTYLSVRL